MSEIKGVAAKLAHIQAAVSNVEKTGWHANQKFKFIQEHKVIELLRPLLREVNAAVVVECADDVLVEDHVSGRDKTPAKLAVLTGRVRFIDADTGDEIAASYAGSGLDTQDKAVGKAQTYLVKYALQKFFLIPTEGIDDSDDDDDSTGKGSPPAKQAASKMPRAKAEELRERITMDWPSVAMWLAANGVSQTEDEIEALRELSPAKAKELLIWVKNGG